MYEALSELNKTTGVTGSMVVGEDGIIIASDLDENVEEEAVGALAASISSSRTYRVRAICFGQSKR